MSKSERLLSYSLLSLITCKPLASAPAHGTTREEEMPSDEKKGLTNSDGAWCWRERCSGTHTFLLSFICIKYYCPPLSLECLKLSKAVQKTCEILQTVANLYDGHV